ncbi:CoA transferase [Saccharopolyspora sp. K220]|uniref:CaiB/BaiF CoA transferase family protein n=1 Tax=Saccharopolyspora soli TaxID=2926618 RepID=UPI001F560A69|nr:CoA transferase [Saccharopolyspora soli]MCI2424374.1 CoA transferase [Saccharopolyspora soli]
MPTDDATGALSGLKVVDLSRVLAGPYCTQMLADHGATVIKIEPPEGDMTREWGPPFRDGISAYYSGLNRNKAHVSVDLRIAAGRDVLLRLLDDADVLVENFKAGTMARWDLGYDEVLAECFPRLVYCRISGFGVDGPMGGLPGYDAVVQAYAGLMDLNGEPGRGPVKLPVPVVDLTTGMLAHGGILTALYERERSGRGQLVDLSLLDSAVSLLHPRGTNYLFDGKQPERLGTSHSNVAPYETFETPQGQLFVGGGNDRQFRALVTWLGVPELADDPRFARNADRVTHRAELVALLRERMAARDLTDVAPDMLRHGVPASMVRSIPEVFDDPQVKYRELLVERDGYRGVGIPVKLDRTPGAVHRIPGPTGRDTVGVLREHGYTAAQIDRLVEDGAVIAS